jgi:hypothetical protein
MEVLIYVTPMVMLALVAVSVADWLRKKAGS